MSGTEVDSPGVDRRFHLIPLGTLANLEGQLARLKQQLSGRSEEPGATPNHGVPLQEWPS